MEYYFARTVGCSYEEAVSRVKEHLKTEGFGVLTEIDVRSTLKKKLDMDFRKYVILGACNPRFAYRALSLEDKVGVLLPCNVVVQERQDSTVEVSAVDPVGMMQAVDNPALQEVARQVREGLKKALERV
ncbi:MAG: DUF302 domain-containing protein [Candidatus Glassbacteria bacterium]|nr:DUF302 domain-containing protein [Candidatus Glassbacteria bacterium]